MDSGFQSSVECYLPWPVFRIPKFGILSQDSLIWAFLQLYGRGEKIWNSRHILIKWKSIVLICLYICLVTILAIFTKLMCNLHTHRKYQCCLKNGECRTWRRSDVEFKIWMLVSDNRNLGFWLIQSHWKKKKRKKKDRKKEKEKLLRLWMNIYVTIYCIFFWFRFTS